MMWTMLTGVGVVGRVRGNHHLFVSSFIFTPLLPLSCCGLPSLSLPSSLALCLAEKRGERGKRPIAERASFAIVTELGLCRFCFPISWRRRAKMLVANSFEMWQKDAFFSAAEEVQESADVMESTYRAWDRVRKESLAADDLNQFSRDLQTSLGTAKWQLEEFEKAVRLSYGRYYDKNTTNRHGQFIAAIRDQISCVEGELQESLCKGAKQPLQWVNLDEEERDDLAFFLSGTSRFLPSPGDDCCKKQDPAPTSACSRGVRDGGLKDGKYYKDDNDCLRGMEAKEIMGTGNEISCNSTAGSWSSPNIADWKIAIADEDERRHRLLPNVDVAPKDKGSRSLFCKQKGGERALAKSVIALFNQLFGRGQVLQRQSHSPRHMQFGRSIQYMFILMLTIFLIVPFVFYST